MNYRNCPNCGAPITGNTCEYCGTFFGNRTYNSLLDYQYEQLKQVQQKLRTQLVLEEMSNNIKNEQIKACCESSQNREPFYFRKPRFRFFQ